MKKDIKAMILAYMQKNSSAPFSSDLLIEELQLKGVMIKEFWQVLAELEDNGEIVKTRFSTYGLPEKMGLVVGRFQLTSKGFGFVIPDHKSDDGDVFIPPRALGSAMNNDRVMARLDAKSFGSKREGEIIRIIKRANNKVVGTFIKTGDFGFVVPDDKKIGRDIYITRKGFGGAAHNQKVVVEITAWPEERKSAEGKVIEVLGSVGDVGLEILSIIKQNDLPLEFPEEVLNAASRIPEKIKKSELTGRRDLRALPIITIDGADAKDLDDAVYVKKQGKDYVLGVYIADVSYYVHNKSAVDNEAKHRGTSVYLVDRVIPMLPERLSNGICSLNAGEDRLCMSCEMLIGQDGQVKTYDIFTGVINVLHRMTYDDVREILVNNDEALKIKYQDIVPMLREMEELCNILRSKRLRRGAIDFDLPEQKVILDDLGKPTQIIPRVRSIAESVIEEFMLAANETVAEHMSKLKWPFVYRVHDLPSEDKMTDLANLLNNFNVRLMVSSEIEPLAVQKALNEMVGRPEERLVSTVTLRSLKQAVYQTENIGHFGLAAEYYTHFTSPIRRYPDLTVHRLLRNWLQKPVLAEKEKTILENELDEIATNSSIRERAAAEAERATVELKMAEYMSMFIGEEFEGTISGVTAFGMFVELENGVEGLVHISSLIDDYYEFHADRYALVGEHKKTIYRLGDKVSIEVLQVNIAERNIDFILAGQSDAMREKLKNQLLNKRETSSTRQLGSGNKSRASTNNHKKTKNTGRKTHKGGKKTAKRINKKR